MLLMYESTRFVNTHLFVYIKNAIKATEHRNYVPVALALKRAKRKNALGT